MWQASCSARRTASRRGLPCTHSPAQPPVHEHRGILVESMLSGQPAGPQATALFRGTRLQGELASSFSHTGFEHFGGASSCQHCLQSTAHAAPLSSAASQRHRWPAHRASTSTCRVVLAVASRAMAREARRRDPVGACPQARSSRCSPLPACRVFRLFNYCLVIIVKRPLLSAPCMQSVQVVQVLSSVQCHA